MSEQIFIGVDLGGTTVKVGVCNPQGELIYRLEGPTDTAGGTEVVLENIAKYTRQAVQESGREWNDVAGIGAGIAGFVDIAEGFVKLSPNLPLSNTPVKKILEEKLGKTVTIDNDANVAALGEAWAGAGKGVANCVVYTLGTGVGGGIIIRGGLYQGFKGLAGELGHIAVVPDLEAIQCNCGQKGCLETVSSATGIVRMAVDAVERGDLSSLSGVEKMTAKAVFDAAKLGDEVALRIVNRAAFYLAKSMTAVAVIMNPQRFIIGGGVSAAGDILFNPIRENFTKLAPEPARDGVDIVPAILGNDAGMIGAAGLNLR
ncbi:ROK family glucokinase [Paenibacillus turpanensis]|uniref:ROK family glucokinase n=1 Tax=Paenibacillus turpanensis TaxID=2689078 RepID=UPI0014093BBC|nr:ROK family glucokinase [Paenibacillus turpanensis]